MSDTNGKTAAVAVAAQTGESVSTDRYRPSPDRDKVYAEIDRALRSVVSESAFQAGQFVSLLHYDRDDTIAVRHQHLVDASECLELAMTYLGQLKALLSHRMRVENDGPWAPDLF